MLPPPLGFTAAAVLQACLLMVAMHHAHCWVNPGFVGDSQRLHLEKPDFWDKLQPPSLNLLFDTDKMYGSCKLQVFGYTESMKKIISKTESPFELLGSNPVSIEKATGVLNALDMGYQCRVISGGSSCAKYHIGFLALTCPSNTDLFYSPVVSLGWLVHPYYVEQKWESWPHSHCLNWYSLEEPTVRSAVRSVACHPLHDYVKLSASEYSYLLAPFNLTKYAGFTVKTVGPKLDLQPTQNCYLSTVDPSTVESQMHASPVALCCYALPSSMGANAHSTYLFKQVESSDNFMLHGSTSFRAHPFGVETHKANFYLPGHVPHLSHWYWDQLPYRYCCLWWSGSSCVDQYQVARPSPQLRPPALTYNSAFILSSLIARPFEAHNAPFMCSGIGEYWLVRNAAFKVQVHTDRVSKDVDVSKLDSPKFNSRSSKSPFVTGLAFQVSSLPHLIFRLLCSETNYKAYMYVTNINRGGRTERIDNSSQRFFGHVSISEPSFAIDQRKTLSFALRHKAEQLGIVVHLVRPELEFMSVLVSAGDNVSPTTGLLGDAAAGGGLASSGPAGSRGLAYLPLCDQNKVATGHADNLFNGKPPEPKLDQGGNATSSGAAGSAGAAKQLPPGAAAAAAAALKRVTRNAAAGSMELAISGKGLADVAGITCQSTQHKKYCAAVEKSSTDMQEAMRLLSDGSPKRDPFRYCTSLPPIRALKAIVHTVDSGLKPDNTMMLTCGRPFRASQEGTARCSGTAKTPSYEVPVDIVCSLIDDMKTADDKALEWFAMNNGSSQFEQHLESYHVRQGGRLSGKKGDNKGAGQLLATSVLLLGLCITLSAIGYGA